MVIDDKAHYLFHLNAIKRDGANAALCDEAIATINAGNLDADIDAFTLIDQKVGVELQRKMDAAFLRTESRPLHALLAEIEDE